MHSSCNGSHHVVMLLVIQCCSPGSSCLLHGVSRQGEWESGGNHHPVVREVPDVSTNPRNPHTDVVLLLIDFPRQRKFSWFSLDLSHWIGPRFKISESGWGWGGGVLPAAEYVYFNYAQVLDLWK